MRHRMKGIDGSRAATTLSALGGGRRWSILRRPLLGPAQGAEVVAGIRQQGDVRENAAKAEKGSTHESSIGTWGRRARQEAG